MILLFLTLVLLCFYWSNLVKILQLQFVEYACITKTKILLGSYSPVMIKDIKHLVFYKKILCVQFM